MQIKAPKDYGFIPEQTEIDSYSERDVTETLPFSLEAEQFINFAATDMKSRSDKDLVNALGNVKRAIENRMDGILFIFRYQELAKDWNFPEKVRKLNNVGVISPRILKKINRIRNLLEHQYRVPKKQEVEDAYDVAILFLAYTNSFIKKNIPEYQCYLEQKGNIHTYLDFRFQDEGFKARIGEKEYHVKPSDPKYDEWIKFTIKRCYFSAM